MKIAMAQMQMSENITENLEKSLLFCHKAKDCDLLFFPEIQLSPFFPQYKKRTADKYCLNINSEEIKFLAQKAKGAGFMKRMIKNIFTVILIAVFVYFISGNIYVEYNNHRLKTAVLSLTDTSSVYFNDLVPFKWDKAYTFSPYTSKAEIENTIGFKSRFIKESVSENMVQIIFVKNRHIVSSICSYPSNLGYGIYFDHIAAYDHNLTFFTETINNIIYLKLK